jgi:uncharacterized protein (TIGR00251 family)
MGAPDPASPPLPIGRSADGVTLAVRVIPRAGRTGVAGTRGGALLVRLAAPPVEGAANDALVDFLARAFDRPKRAIRIVSGHSSRDKRVTIDGLGADAAARVLSAILAGR